MQQGGYIYIMTNKNNTTLYVGVTSDLISRVLQHRQMVHPKSFTARYNLTRIVYFEIFDTMQTAIEREKQLKAGPRKVKEALINKVNPEWNDLFDQIQDFN